MPEGPETRIYSEQLSSLLGVPFISDCDSSIEHGTLEKWNYPVLERIIRIGPSNILEKGMNQLHGLRCRLIKHRGKVTVLNWDDQLEMFVAYGMTGSWSLEKSEFSRVEFVFQGKRSLFFQDVRKFGRIGIRECHRRLENIGLSIFDQNYRRDRLPGLKRRFGQRSIRRFLLDPSTCPGVGNYICNEALWHAKEHPVRKVNSMTESELWNVIRSCRNVYRNSLRLGGMTFSDFCKMDGSSGAFQLKVKCYRKQNCERCGCPIIRIKDGPSSIYCCPNCSPEPR